MRKMVTISVGLGGISVLGRMQCSNIRRRCPPVALGIRCCEVAEEGLETGKVV